MHQARCWPSAKPSHRQCISIDNCQIFELGRVSLLYYQVMSNVLGVCPYGVDLRGIADIEEKIIISGELDVYK